MIDIDSLTIGEIKKIKSLLAHSENEEPHKDIGKMVIIRTYSSGVHFGKLQAKNGNECILTEAVRIWSWSGAASLSQMAMEGVKNPEECKFAMPVESITLQWIEIIPCTPQAVLCIKNVPSWKV